MRRIRTSGIVGLVLASWLLVASTTRLDAADIWTCEPDPLEGRLRVSADAVARVRRGSPAHAVVFSSQPSPFVLTSGGPHELPEVGLWDLSTGKVTSRFTMKREDLDGARLSSDGRYLAGRQFDSGTYYSTVWDLTNGKVLWQEKREDAAVIKRVAAKLRDFVGPEQVVLIGESWVRIVNFVTGELVKEFESRTPCRDVEQSVLSPGRRYLARHESAAIYLYELASGEVAGTLRPPIFADASLAKIERFRFSQDGKELAALLSMVREVAGRPRRQQVIVNWSIADGKLISQHELPTETVEKLMQQGGYTPNIACLPDHSGWWVNNGGIVDRKSGGVAWLVPKVSHVASLGDNGQFLEAGKLLLHVVSPEPGDPVLAIVQTPRRWDRPGAVPKADALAGGGEAKRAAARDDARPAPKARPGKKPEADKPPAAAGRKDADRKDVEDRLKKVTLIRDEERMPIADAELERCLGELLSGDDEVIVAALEKLALALPEPKHSKRVVRAAQNHLSRRDNQLLQRMASAALKNWDKAGRISPDLRKSRAAGEAVAVDFKKLEGEVGSGNVGQAFNAIKYLGDSGDARAAEILVKFYERYPPNCGKALRSLGPVAAPAVARLLDSEKTPTRIAAAELLKDIGTKEEMPALEKAAKDDANAHVRRKASDAIASIKKRK